MPSYIGNWVNRCLYWHIDSPYHIWIHVFIGCRKINVPKMIHKWATIGTYIHWAIFGWKFLAQMCQKWLAIGEKRHLRSSQDLNLGPLNSDQMLLPMSYWSFGIGAEDRWHLSIDTVRFSNGPSKNGTWLSHAWQIMLTKALVTFWAKVDFLKAMAPLYRNEHKSS